MARELRSRKVASDPKNGEAQAAAADKNTKSKRKAAPAENASPIPRKLQKGSKKTPVVKEDKKEPAEEEPEVGSETESEQGEEAEALAAELDPQEAGDDTPEGGEVYKTGQPVGTIPDVSQAVEKAARTGKSGDAGVIYIGRIPHGFYEHEMRQYFSQFGPISKLRLSRNKKTGASRHFAFIEFAEASTADIVAKTMNNYLLFGHILKCRTIPAEQVHPDLFKGANRRFKKIPWNKIAGRQLEKPLSESNWAAKVAREQTKRAKKADKLKALGYEFDAPDIKNVPPPAAPVPEVPQDEVKAIENGDAAKEAVEEPKAEEPKAAAETESKDEEPKSISAPKTKAKGTRAAKSRKAKA